MHDIWIYVVTFLASLLTLVTGFGLGTILTPIFTLVYEVKFAILLVAIIHFLNNLLKIALFRKSVDFTIVKRFGLISIVGAVVGAFLQVYLYSGVLKIILGVVLIALGISEYAPKSMNIRFPQKVDYAGGFLSGLLGGLVGNQGAIRSAYLLNYQISKETFIATATVIALTIDVTRIPVYIVSDQDYLSRVQFDILIVIAIAFLGTIVGKRVVTFLSTIVFKKIVAGFVLMIGVLFVLGIV
ncbi:MAG: sulfite exporter TauE/SafE family protein [Ignavibacteriae bacterium]|nr:sulfite exporter TauE/SafE family protein [Ignavibacteriota bacterium]